MKRKWISKLLVFFGVMIPSFAIADMPSNNIFNGFYVGVAGGGSFTSGHEDTVGGGSHLFSDFQQTFASRTFSSNDLINNALKGALYAGLGGTWQFLYLGTEIFTDISDYDMRSSGQDGFKQIISPVLQIRSGYTTKVKLNPVEYGFDLRPGILLGSGTLIYSRIGTAINRLSLDTTATGTLDQFPPIFLRETFGGTFPFSATTTRAALRLGAGFEQYISPRLTLRADYIYTDYGKIHVNGSTIQNVMSADFGPLISTISSDSNIKVINNSVLLGLSYYFSNSANSAFDPMLIASTAFNGIYAGIAGGGSFTSGSVDIFANTLVNANNNAQIPYSQTSDLSNNALKGAIFVGYGHSWDALYLGGEIFGTLSHYAVENSGREQFFQLQPPDAPLLQDLSTLAETKVNLRSGEFGADFCPGIVLTPVTLIYGRIGVAFNRLSLDSNTSSLFQFFPGTGFVEETINPRADFSAAEKRSALRLGGGVEEHLNSHFAVRGDYIYTDYGKIGTSGMTTTNVDSPNLGMTHFTLVNNDSLHVRNNTVMLGLIYYFAVIT